MTKVLFGQLHSKRVMSTRRPGLRNACVDVHSLVSVAQTSLLTKQVCRSIVSFNLVTSKAPGNSRCKNGRRRHPACKISQRGKTKKLVQYITWAKMGRQDLNCPLKYTRQQTHGGERLWAIPTGSPSSDGRTPSSRKEPLRDTKPLVTRSY